MTSAAVNKFDQFFMVIARDLLMTIQTEAHVKDLRIFGNRLLGHVAVTVLAVLSRRNVGAVIELDEVGDLRDGDPLQRLSADDCLFQRRKQQAGLCFGNLVVTCPAFGLGWNASGRSLRRARMAIQTLDAESDVRLMWKLNGLFWSLLGERNAIRGKTKNRQQYNSHRNQTEWLSQPVKESFDHGCS